MNRLRASSTSDSLRDRLIDDGYLYLPGFRSADEIADIAEPIRRTLRGAGWLDGTRGWDLAPAAREQLHRGSYREVYPTLQGLEAVHRFTRSDLLLSLMGELLDGVVFGHPAKAIRLAVPEDDEVDGSGTGYSTDPHQDFVRLLVASDVLTAWTCVTACSSRRRGISILSGSHRGGYAPPDRRLGRSLPVYLPVSPDDPGWLSADYQPGDVVIFHSLTVHSGGLNTSEAVRVSVDARYQRVTDPIDDRWLHPHGWPDVPDWDVLGREWSTQEWVDVPPGTRVVPSAAVDRLANSAGGASASVPIAPSHLLDG